MTNKYNLHACGDISEEGSNSCIMQPHEVADRLNFQAARIAELEQGIDSQAILAAAKELGRVEVAAVMYQVMGTIDASAMPEGEWMRCMDWLSSTANGQSVGELLPVGAIGESK